MMEKPGIESQEIQKNNSVFYVVIGVLIGVIIVLSFHCWNLNKVNELYLLTINNSCADVAQYHRVQDGMLEAIKALASNK